MNRRQLFQSAASLYAGVVLQCFGVVDKISVFKKTFRSETICFVDAMFAKESERLLTEIKNVWETRSAFSYLMEKAPKIEN